MGALIGRATKWTPTQQLSLTTSSSTTPEIPMQEFAAGAIFIPVGSSITTLTFYGAPRPSSDPLPTDPQVLGHSATAPTFYALHTNDNLDTAITLTVSAGNCYFLPFDIFAFGALKITVDVAGTVEIAFKA